MKETAQPAVKRGRGRPKGAVNKAKLEMRDLAIEHVPAMLAELIKIAQKSESDSARVAAIKEIFDRAYGKAPQSLVGSPDDPPIKQVLEIVWGASTKSGS